jgi:hypothetical protein
LGWPSNDPGPRPHPVLRSGRWAAFAQSYSGSITSASCKSISGTATVNGAPASVDVYSDGVYLGTTQIGYVWSFGVPQTVMDNQVQVITAMFGGTTVPVGNSQYPQSIECQTSSGGYSYSFTDTFPGPTFKTADWTVYGAAGIYTGARFSTGTNSYGPSGSVIATVAATPANPSGFDPSHSDYEVSTTLTIVPGAVGANTTYFQYLRASGNPSVANTTYFAVSLAVQSCPGWGLCTGSLSAYEMYNNGQQVQQVTYLQGLIVSCWNNMTIRTVVSGNSANIMVNGKVYQTNILATPGLPGVGGIGVAGGNLISQVQFGPLDIVPPSPVNPNNADAFTTEVYPNSVTAGWQAAVDNPTQAAMWTNTSLHHPVPPGGTRPSMASSHSRRRPS